MTVVPELRQLAKLAPASRAATYTKAADEIEALRAASARLLEIEAEFGDPTGVEWDALRAALSSQREG